MDLRQLTYFMAVAEELHFGKAAAKLHISQPPLSRQIMELEEELGAKLFERTSRGVVLTKAGTFLKIEASRLLSLSVSIQERVKTLGDEGTRNLRIGYVGSVMHSFLPELMVAFRKALPNVAWEFLELGTDEQIRALRKGDIELAFLRSWLHDAGIRFVPLFEESLVVVCGRDFLPRPRRTEGLAGYRDLPFISFSSSYAPLVANRAEDACERAGFVPRTVFTANQYDTAIRLVAAGLGWSIVPASSLLSAATGLIAFPLDDGGPGVEVGIALREGEGDPELLELVEVARKWFAETGVGRATRSGIASALRRKVE